MVKKKNNDEIPYGLQWELERTMRKFSLKKGKGKKARSLIEQLLDLFEWD